MLMLLLRWGEAVKDAGEIPSVYGVQDDELTLKLSEGWGVVSLEKGGFVPDGTNIDQCSHINIRGTAPVLKHFQQIKAGLAFG